MLRRARWLLVAGVGLLALYAALLASRPLLEREARSRLERAAADAGFSLTIGGLRLTPGMTLELRDLVLERGGQVQIAMHTVAVRASWSLRGLVGRAARVSLGVVVARLAAGLELDIAPSDWRVESLSSGLRLSRLASGERLRITVSKRERVMLQLQASNARLSRFVSPFVHGCALGDPGTLEGEARVERLSAEDARVTIHARLRGLALVSLAAVGEAHCPTSFGAPTDVAMDADAAIRPGKGALDAERVRVSAGGTEAIGRLVVAGGWSDPRVDVQFDVARLPLARLLATAGLDLPADDLGSAVLSGRVTGRLFDPASLAVTQRLDFTPPGRAPAALARLRGPFVHQAEAADGRSATILVSPESPDFVPLAEVPQLFLRTLLIAEDANFYGHPGVDLAELKAAIAVNLSRRAFVRGASTISQQLAKNLFLSRKRTVGRKLEEASLALLLDSTLGKSRILEIYLNVIEWGPGVYGLRPAARQYFGREPAALTPKQIAFLVSLIPGPVKYQRSFASGVPTPFFDGLMTTLLGKLESVGALSPAEYEAALVEPLGLIIRSEPAALATPAAAARAAVQGY